MGWLLLVAACDDPTTVPPTDGELIIGSASASGLGFIEVVDGDEVELVGGAQGGFHVWLNLRVHGTEGRFMLEREARRVSDDTLILRATKQRLEVPREAMNLWWESPQASPAFMCPSPLGIQVFDNEVEYLVRLLSDDDELIAEDHITLIPRCPSDEQNRFCREICSG